MTQEEYNVQLQNNREIYTKIQLLDWNENVIDEIQGLTIGGSIDVNGDSNVRRTANIKMIVNEDNLVPSPTSKIWLNRKMKIFVGIKDNSTNQIKWFNQGIYLFDNPSIRFDLQTREMDLKGLDKMCWLNGTLSGYLKNPTKIDVDTPFFDTIKNIAQLNGETKIIINDVDGLTIPYTIEKASTDSITALLDDVKNLYMWYEYFYDIEGNFIFQKIKDRKNDIVKWDFDENNIVINYENSPNWENIKNDIWIWGRLLEDGTQIKYHLQNTDVNSDFCIDKIGVRDLVISDDKILSQEVAQIKAEYEMYLRSNFCEKINFNCNPIYNLQINDVIEITNHETGINGRYKVNKFSLNLDVDGNLNIECQKLYYEN